MKKTLLFAGAYFFWFVAAAQAQAVKVSILVDLDPATTGALGGILILALVVVVCNEVINRTEAYLLRWRPKEDAKTQRELY